MAKILSFPTANKKQAETRPRKKHASEPAWSSYVEASPWWCCLVFLKHELELAPLKLSKAGALSPELSAELGLGDSIFEQGRTILEALELAETSPRALVGKELDKYPRDSEWMLWSQIYKHVRGNPGLVQAPYFSLEETWHGLWDTSLGFLRWLCEKGPAPLERLHELALPILELEKHADLAGVSRDRYADFADRLAGQQAHPLSRSWFNYLVLGYFVPLGFLTLEDKDGTSVLNLSPLFLALL